MRGPATARAGMHHFGVTRGATVIAVSMMGPYTMTYIRPSDEPWGVYPYGY